MNRNKNEAIRTLPVFSSQRTLLKEELYLSQMYHTPIEEMISNTYDNDGTY
jgi:hypothetical protein